MNLNVNLLFIYFEKVMNFSLLLSMRVINCLYIISQHTYNEMNVVIAQVIKKKMWDII